MGISCIFLVLVLGVALGQFNVGDQACFKAGLNMRNGVCGGIVGTSTGSESGSVLAIQRKQCDFGTFTWVQVKLPSKVVWVAHETNLVQKCGAGRNTNIPMVHQRWDTGDAFGGSWACGPVSMLMIVAHFKKVPPKPIHTSSPHPHMNDFGWYVSNIYTSLTGKVWNRGQKDSAGKMAYGAYGHCVETKDEKISDEKGAWAWRMQQYAEGHGLKTKFYSASSLAAIHAEIDRGAFVVLRNPNKSSLKRSCEKLGYLLTI
jgi:hypothetical protein